MEPKQIVVFIRHSVAASHYPSMPFDAPVEPLPSPAYLTRFPVLAGLGDDALRPLAEALVLRRYDDGHAFFCGEWPCAADPLRLVVHGRIARGSSVARERAGAWSLTPGAVLGLDAVADWAGVELRARPPAGIDARAHGVVWVLELAAQRFAQVFAGPGVAVLERLLAAAPVRHIAPRLVAALRAQPVLARVPERELYRALEGARIDRDAQAIHFVIRGRAYVRDAGGGRLTLEPGTLEPFSPGARAHTIGADPDAELIAIPRASLLAALRRTPGFARSLAQLTSASERVETGVELSMIVFDEALTRTAVRGSSLVEALADAITQQFDERVGIVRLLAGERGAAEPHAWPHTLGYVDASRLRRELEAIVRRFGLCFDHLLIDTSALALDDPLRASLWSVVAELGCAARINYVFDDPARFDELPVRLAGAGMPPVDLLPVAVLRRTAPHRVDTAPAHELASGPERVGGILARLTHALAQAHEDPVRAQLRGEPPQRRAWPLEAVRLELELEHEREQSCHRWARAIASRRVGIAIAAAGAQSYVALPLLRRLQAAGVPIDLLSGASVGAFIASFHAAFGERGLAQLERAWPRLQALVLEAYVSNAPLTRWLLHASAGLDLADLSIPAIVVSTDAETGQARHHTVGLLAKACMASGSIPPAMPTHVGERRLLDGALVEDVPAAILSAAGADLIVAVQACPPMHGDPRLLPRPRTAGARWRRSFSLGLRLWDFGRSHLMLCRLAAARGSSAADVIYSATTTASNPGLFVQVPRIIAEASVSPALLWAQREVEALWASSRAAAPTRVRVAPDTGVVELGPALTLALDHELRLDGDGEALIAALARFVGEGAELELILEVWLDQQLDEAAARACFARLQACAGADRRVTIVHHAAAPAQPSQVSLRLIPESRSCTAS